MRLLHLDYGITVFLGQGQRRVRLLHCADGDDDLLQAGLPGALHHVRIVGRMLLRAVVASAKHLVRQIGANIYAEKFSQR